MNEAEALQAVGDLAQVRALYVQGDLHDSGRVIAYCDAPSVIIERPDGSRFSWRADLTEIAGDAA